MEKSSNLESILGKSVDNYIIKHILFATTQYIYLVVEYKKNSMRFTAAIAKKSQQSCQYIKMFRSKLKSKMPQELIFPSKEISSIFNGIKITLSIFKNEFIPLKKVLKTFQNANQEKIIVLFRDLLYTLYVLHSNDVFHGRISPSTVYVQRQKFKQQCSFALNILDAAYFFDKHYPEKTQELLFCSEAQSYDLNLCEKDDLESLVYLVVHICSGSMLFTTNNLHYEIKKDSAKIPKWKSSFFFGEMQCILPPNLIFIKEFYLQIKNTNRSQKANYVKWLKRAEMEKVIFESGQRKAKMSEIQTNQGSKRCARLRRLNRQMRSQQNSETNSQHCIEKKSSFKPEYQSNQNQCHFSIVSEIILQKDQQSSNVNNACTNNNNEM